MIRKAIDPKYTISVGWDGCGSSIPSAVSVEIVKETTGEPIPADEPLILFRSRDRHALQMLRYYRELCSFDNCTDFHLAGIANRITAFQQFADEYPERMKQPGITKGL